MADKTNANITIKSIAQRLGVSFSTVAKALNDDPLVKEETRKLVQQTAAEMGYLPNIMAKGLRSRSMKTVGVILNDLENPIHMHIVKKIMMDISQYGYTTLIFDSMYDPVIERNNIATLLSRMPDGVVIAPVSVHSHNISLLRNLLDRTVILSPLAKPLPTNYVRTNHERGAYVAAATMLNSGHTCNLIFAEPPDFPVTEQFLSGVRRAYRERGILLDESLMLHRIPSLDAGFEGVRDAYEARKGLPGGPFTGVIASCDSFAFGAYKAAAKLGLCIPEDLSVIGYDDNPMAALATPPLTTMHMPKEAIGAYCSEILISKLIQKDPNLSSYLVEAHLVQRESIRRLPVPA